MSEFQPSGDRKLSFAHPKHRVRALFHGHLLADSDSVTVVREAGEPDRHFFPRDKVAMEYLPATDFVRTTSKGEARFFTIYRDREVLEHGAWSIEHPVDQTEDLRGLITFDLDVVTIEEEDAPGDTVWTAEAQRMSDYIRHTDSGSGRSQDTPWAANVNVPGNNLGEDEEIDDRPTPRA